MPELTAKDIAEKLAADRFKHSGAEVQALSDPIVDTPMVVTLDELRAYDLNPRVTRNPRHDDIKASIRDRGLEAPPPITRRPGEAHFIIRNGGNTRLGILRELWTETKDDKFFRITCLFRPWSARGEIVALTGHLAENELRGELSFIERALGTERARELYEQETGHPMTQVELARRLAADGYPITQSHISRMQDAIRFLLPAIPTVLYAGLGKHQVEKLTALRKAASRTWDRYTRNKKPAADFADFFQDVLITFDGELGTFNIKRIRDELVGQLSQLLGIDYDTISLEFVDAEARLNALTLEPTTEAVLPVTTAAAERPPSHAPRADASNSAPASPKAQAAPPLPSTTPEPAARESSQTPATHSSSTQQNNELSSERLLGHVISPAETTDRLQSIRRTIANATGDAAPDFKTNVVNSIPVQAGGLFPISDVWYIEPALDAQDRLRIHIAQLATEIAQEANLAHRVESMEQGIGFVCTSGTPATKESPLQPFERSVLALLHVLSASYILSRPPVIDSIRLVDDLAPLLQGMSLSRRMNPARLSDAGIVKLFRLIRLARRILELDSNTASQPTGSPGQ